MRLARIAAVSAGTLIAAATFATTGTPAAADGHKCSILGFRGHPVDFCHIEGAPKVVGYWQLYSEPQAIWLDRRNPVQRANGTWDGHLGERGEVNDPDDFSDGGAFWTKPVDQGDPADGWRVCVTGNECTQWSDELQ